MTDSRTSTSSSQPSGLISWLRRRLLPKCAKLCAFIGIITLGLWITGRILTDQYSWSQYLWWMPSIWMIGGAWFMLVCSGVLAISSRRPSGLMMRPVLLLMGIGCTGYLFFGVWHLHRYVVRSPIPDDSIRIVHWNQAGFKADQAALGQRAIELDADVVLVANSQWGNGRRTLLESLAPLSPAAESHMVTKGFQVVGNPGHFRITGDAFIASRFPILRTATVTSGTRRDQESVFKRGSDFGWIVLVELDISDTDSPNESLVIWFVDLPSDPSLWRMNSMQQVANSISQWDGTEFVKITPDGKRTVWSRVETDQDFPEPDVIIGDFNTPSGSHSIGSLAENMTDAYRAVGYGRTSSWRPKIKSKIARQPFKLADWHIDLSLTGPTVQPVGYSIENTSKIGNSEHWMQILDLKR